MLRATDYTLEFLLAFDGRIHHLEEGHWLKFEIKKVKATKRRPHGLSYSFTEGDIGRSYEFKDAATLLDDFFDEVERVLRERGVGMTVVAVEEIRRSK
jgi:hypothetical protein